MLIFFANGKERARTAGSVEMWNCTATTDIAARCRVDGFRKDAVLVGFDMRAFSMIVSTIAVFAHAAGQSFARFSEYAAAYYTVAS